MQPQEAGKRLGLEKLNAGILLPSNCSVTCHGGRGSLIDYAIVSCILVPYVVTVQDVPWSPHDGLRLTLRAEPLAIPIKTIVKPRPLPSKDDRQCQTMSWREAKKAALNEVQKDMMSAELGKVLSKVAHRMGTEESSRKVGSRYAAWARALEIQRLEAHQVPTEKRQAFLGRACEPKLKTLPLSKRPRLDARTLDVAGGCGIVTKLWATFASLLRKVKIARIPGKPLLYSELKISVLKLLASQDADKKAAWEANDCKEDKLALVYAVSLALRPDADEAALETAVQVATRLENTEARRNSESSQARWEKWACDVLRNGSSKAHRWTSMHSHASANMRVAGMQAPQEIADATRLQWESIWLAHDREQCEETDRVVERLAQENNQETVDEWCAKITDEVVKAVSKDIRARTPIEVDNLALQDIASADQEAYELADIFRETLCLRAWPSQALGAIVALLGKKSGGTRCICICATYHKILMNIMKQEVQEWDLKVGSPHDSAGKHRQPRLETAKRALMMEQHSMRGNTVVAVFWDIEKRMILLITTQCLCKELRILISQKSNLAYAFKRIGL